MLTIRLIRPGETEGHAACRALREAVFVTEQGIDRTIELDDRDTDCTHVLIQYGDRAVATGRMLPEGRIGRMAVEANARNRGLGTLLLQGLEAAAQDRQLARVSLHAQHSALGFYERSGYQRCGEDFIEAGILHTPMDRSLPPRDLSLDATMAALQQQLAETDIE